METPNNPQHNLCCNKCNNSTPYQYSLIVSCNENNLISFEEYICTYCNDENNNNDDNNDDANRYINHDENESSWYEEEYDSDEFYDELENDKCFEIEDIYEFKFSPKGKRGSSSTSIKNKLSNKAKRNPVKSCIQNKRILKIEQRNEQLKAGKERRRNYYSTHGYYASNSTSISLCQKSVSITKKTHYTYKAHHSTFSSLYTYPETILSADELGVQSGAMYDRLMEIMNGGNITPEDFDLLLQLDGGNTKTTLNCDVIKEFDVVTVEVGLKSEIWQTEARCLICLDAFKEMQPHSELRRLPCGHFFCKECIDVWLSNMSSKCPDLSCYWRNNDQLQVSTSANLVPCLQDN